MYRPEVGEECVWYSDRGNKIGKECVIEWTDGEYYTVRNKDSFKLVQTVSDVKFRPLKSKRDEYCCEVYDILKNSQSIPECCERLYDAGYRKQLPYDDALDILIKVESLNLSFEDGIEKLGYTPEDN
jgi:hypothetical protein